MSVRPRPYSPTGVTMTLTAPASRSASATGPAVSALTRAIMFPPRPPPESFAPPAPAERAAATRRSSCGQETPISTSSSWLASISGPSLSGSPDAIAARAASTICPTSSKSFSKRSGERFEKLFDDVGQIVEAARAAIASGEPERLGPLMDANHELLVEMGVSCPQLDRLVAAARSAGAGGAKLSGGGRGGNMIALVSAETAGPVAEALREAGAVRVIVTPVGEYG